MLIRTARSASTFGSRGSGQPWLRQAITARRATPFSTSSAALRPASPEKEHETRNGHQAGAQRSYTSVLAVLAVGVVAGGTARYISSDASKTKTSPSEFVTYTLSNKQAVSSTSSIFTLRPSTSTQINIDDPSLQHAITSIQFKQPQLQIARAYTLLPPHPDHEHDSAELRFLIRQEQRGEVSGYLHRLPLGAQVELRGPAVDWVLPDAPRVLFLAGGTGIAPALQVAEKLSGVADVHILWANRQREDSLGGISDTAPTSPLSSWNPLTWWTPSARDPVSMAPAGQNAIIQQIEALKTSTAHHLHVDYFVDDESTFITPNIVKGRIASLTDTASSKPLLILVSGPEGFVNYWAGPKQWSQGREVQGSLGGVLASTIDSRRAEVVKL